MSFCCKRMADSVAKIADGQGVDSDDLICYEETVDEYGIIIHDGGRSYIGISYCPWCGKRLPESKRDLWFEELCQIGYEEPLEQDIPVKYRTSEWWK